MTVIEKGAQYGFRPVYSTVSDKGYSTVIEKGTVRLPTKGIVQLSKRAPYGNRKRHSTKIETTVAENVWHSIVRFRIMCTKIGIRNSSVLDMAQSSVAETVRYSTGHRVQ